MSNAPFEQVNPGLTKTPPDWAAGGGVPVVEGSFSTYTKVYTISLTSQAASTSGFVDNNGIAIVDLNNASVDVISAAGVKTNDATHTSGGNATTQGARSVAGTYVALIATQVAGVNVWKNGVFLQNLATAVTTPNDVNVSPNGKYILILYTGAVSQAELWVGS